MEKDLKRLNLNSGENGNESLTDAGVLMLV